MAHFTVNYFTSVLILELVARGAHHCACSPASLLTPVCLPRRIIDIRLLAADRAARARPPESYGRQGMSGI